MKKNEKNKHINTIKIFISFIPWIAFWVLGGNIDFLHVITISFALSLLFFLKDFQQKKYKVLDIGTLIFFVAVLLSSFTQFLEKIQFYALPLSNLAMFVIVLFSLLIRKPFTIEYAKEEVEEQYWKSSRFQYINFVLSNVWGLAFAINAVVSYLYVLHPQNIDLIVHALSLLGAIVFTAWYPKYARKSKPTKLS